MKPEQKSAIIGYWRSGATVSEISLITGIHEATIERIINDYKDNIIIKKLSALNYSWI